MPTHVRQARLLPSASQSSFSSFNSSTSFSTPNQQQRLFRDTQAGDTASTSSSRSKRHFRFRCFRLRFLSSRGTTFRLLGAAVCACSLFHFVVHLFVSDLFELLSGAVPVPVGSRREYVRNLTWHLGPELREEDRRWIVVYSSPFLWSGDVETAISSHPRVVWVPEQLLHKYAKNVRVTPRANATTMARHLFNCSNTALPLILHVVNEETVSRGETKWCLPKGGRGTRGARSANAKCKQYPASCSKAKAKPAVKDECRKVTRRQLRTFCLQHHPAVRLSDSWRLRHIPELLGSNLKVLHLVGTPSIYKNETSKLHFSGRTHKLHRVYRSVVVEPRRRRACEQLADDLEWLAAELSDSSAWFYQRFPLSCFGEADPESCVLELYNFLDIYVSENVRTYARTLANRTSSIVNGGDRDHRTSGSSFGRLDLSKLTEDETHRRLKEIYTEMCKPG